MSFTYINREIYPKMLVQDEPLDDNYAKGYSYDDYSKGIPAPWIELGEEQLAFKEANPKATVKEIIEAKLDESRLLNEEKSVKYEEIRTYETGNLYEFFLDDQNIYIPEHDRRNALSDGAIAGKITIMGLEFDITEGKILIGMMDKYDNDLMSALGDKQKQINLATTVDSELFHDGVTAASLDGSMGQWMTDIPSYRYSHKGGGYDLSDTSNIPNLIHQITLTHNDSDDNITG